MPLSNYLVRLISFLVAICLISCSAPPQVVVDPKSIKDIAQYESDMAECKTVSESYDASTATAGSAVLGAGAALGTAAMILATGGLYLLPSGVAVVGAGGATAGGEVSQNRESRAREKIWASCMSERGYRAYSSN